MSAESKAGFLLAVVGPSGVGKDTVMRHARPHLPDMLFVRRTITRPADPHEDHQPCDEATFCRLTRDAAFCATWSAHGLHYGIPASARDHVSGGGGAIVNGSRNALTQICKAIPTTRIVEIVASPTVRAQRLAIRGRETPREIQYRLQRASLDYPERSRAVFIVNEGCVEDAALRLVELVRTMTH